MRDVQPGGREMIHNFLLGEMFEFNSSCGVLGMSGQTIPESFI